MTVSALPPAAAGEKPRAPILTELRINGTTPFTSPRDGAAERLNEAHGLLLVLAQGHDFAEDVGAPANEEFDNIRHQITSSALNGIATLLALAMHHIDVSDAERRAV